MSQENVEVVRQVLDHWNDTGELLWELLDPEFEYVIDPPAWLAGTYRGQAELSDLIRRVAEVFDEFRFEVDDLVPVGDRVVSLGGFRVRGALSGAGAVQAGGAGLHELRDGRIVRIRVYFDREQALRNAGLRE
jgi:ketosteroid isomerase-like protein